MTCMYIVCTIYIFNFPAPFYAEFPRLQYKRAGTSNIFLSFSIQFLYVSCLVATGGPYVSKGGEGDDPPLAFVVLLWTPLPLA